MLQNVTFSAEAKLIEQARKKATIEHTTLNAQFREWLSRYVQQTRSKQEYRFLMKELAYADAGRRFTRDELNER